MDARHTFSCFVQSVFEVQSRSRDQQQSGSIVMLQRHSVLNTDVSFLYNLNHTQVHHYEMFQSTVNDRQTDMNMRVKLLVANTLLFTSVNLSGLFVRILTERAQRKAFLQARNCIEERLRMEDENEKQERLLMSLLPRNVAMEMKEDFLKPPERIFHKIYIQRHDNVSEFIACVLGMILSDLVLDCLSLELRLSLIWLK
ncbi:hypothetical protein QQF64_007485 [Cirrhinus molitorella]|uniref:Adenylate cyclase N-terminal domain-containing protein n=1 Tax=Cirrhinus molitorella TaxID=172907 RepID=A0ABR3MAU5_9TELE